MTFVDKKSKKTPCEFRIPLTKTLDFRQRLKNALTKNQNQIFSPPNLWVFIGFYDCFFVASPNVTLFVTV